MAASIAKPTAPRTRKARGVARQPARERGVQRFSQLLDATDALLSERHADDIGLYAIADKAGIPPASVYHFFPTVEAAFLALTRRYLDGFVELFNQPVEPQAFASWHGFVARDQQLSIDFYNAHPAAMKLFLGRYGGEETRKADIAFNREAGVGLWRRLQFAFEVPQVPGAPGKFTNMLFIQDALWAASYAESGCISPDYAQESHRAGQAYLRLYLPEHMSLRPEIAADVAAGASISFSPPTPRTS